MRRSRKDRLVSFRRGDSNREFVLIRRLFGLFHASFDLKYYRGFSEVARVFWPPPFCSLADFQQRFSYESQSVDPSL